MVKYMKLYLMVIFTDKMTESINFYQQLGFKLKSERFEQGPEHFCMTLGETVFDLFPAADKATQHLRFGVELDDNVDTTLIQTLADETFDIGEGKAYSVLKDPNGNTIEAVYRKA